MPGTHIVHDDYVPNVAHRMYSLLNTTKMTIQPSIGDKLNILFKGNYFIIGSFFSLIGGVLSVFFVSKTDYKSISYFNTELIHSEAVVIDINETNCSTNDNRILEYKYRFLDYDKTQIGFSYSYNSPINIEDTVQIEFVQDDLKTSRIVGMINAPYDLYVGGFVLIFPLLGLGFIISDLKKLFKYLKILKDFSFTTGELISKEKTSTEINDFPLYKIKYEYEHHRKNHINTSRSLSPKEFKETEELIYSNGYPEHSVLLKKLPKGIENEIKSI